jgi:hypothetical protein
MFLNYFIWLKIGHFLTFYAHFLQFFQNGRWSPNPAMIPWPSATNFYGADMFKICFLNSMQSFNSITPLGTEECSIVSVALLHDFLKSSNPYIRKWWPQKSNSVHRHAIRLGLWTLLMNCKRCTKFEKILQKTPRETAHFTWRNRFH